MTVPNVVKPYSRRTPPANYDKGFLDQEEQFIEQAIRSLKARAESNPVANIQDQRFDGGARGDGLANDYGPVLAAANSLPTSGGVVFVPPGIYALGTGWPGKSNITFQGCGQGVSVFRDHPSLGANRLFPLIGTSGAHLSNITFRDLTIRNGTASTGNPTTGKDGIRTEYVDGLTLSNVLVTEIQGNFGLITKYSTKIALDRNTRFYRHTYCGYLIGVECDGVKLTDVEFDTATSLTTAQTYNFAAGGEASNEGLYFCKKVALERVRSLNNPRWEAFDFHGGEDLSLLDCYAENCMTGILMALAQNYVTNPVLKTMRIRNFKAVQGTGANDGFGVIIEGIDDSTIRAENYRLENCRFDGFGGVTSNNNGVIKLQSTRDGHLKGSRYDNWHFSAVMPFSDNADLVIEDEIYGNCANPSFSAITAAISLRSGGNVGVRVRGGTLKPDDLTKAPPFFLSSEIKSNSIQIEQPPTILFVTNAPYRNTAFLPVERSTIPTTNLIQRYGDIIRDTSGKPAWSVTAVAGGNNLGYGSLDTSVILTVNMTAGSAIATLASGSFLSLPEGMNVSIAGAGVAAAALTARILKNNVTTITLDTNASTSVVGANLTYQSITLEALDGRPKSIAFATSPYTTTEADKTIFCDASGGAIGVTLIAAASVPGKEFTIIKTEAGANAVTISRSGANTINGATTLVLAGGARGQAKVVSDGTNYYIASVS